MSFLDDNGIFIRFKWYFGFLNAIMLAVSCMYKTYDAIDSLFCRKRDCLTSILILTWFTWQFGMCIIVTGWCKNGAGEDLKSFMTNRICRVYSWYDIQINSSFTLQKKHTFTICMSCETWLDIQRAIFSIQVFKPLYVGFYQGLQYNKYMDALFRKKQCSNEVCRVKNLEVRSWYNFLISPWRLYKWLAMTCVCYYLRVLTNEVGNAGSVSFPRAVFRFEHLTSRLIYWCTGCRRTRVRCRANTHSVWIDCLVRIDIAINLKIKLCYNISAAVCKSCRWGK